MIDTDDDEWDAYNEGYAEFERGVITKEEYLAGCAELDEKRRRTDEEATDA